MSTTTTAVLPVSGHTVPASTAALRLKITGYIPLMREGEAFTIEVRHDGRLIGTIEQAGNGGGTDFRHHSREARELWEGWVAEYAAIDADHAFIAEEALANDLADEALQVREFNGKRTPVFRKVGGNSAEYYTVPRTKPSEMDAARWDRIQASVGAPIEFWSSKSDRRFVPVTTKES